jgi:hypothetical protein
VNHLHVDVPNEPIRQRPADEHSVGVSDRVRRSTVLKVMAVGVADTESDTGLCRHVDYSTASASLGSVEDAAKIEMEYRLSAAGSGFAIIRQNVAAARDNLQALAAEATDLKISQQRIAELLGVDRMTVRKWVGKR